jgi:hypothetical protein
MCPTQARRTLIRILLLIPCIVWFFLTGYGFSDGRAAWARTGFALALSGSVLIFTRGLLHRRDPIVRITGDDLEWGSPFYLTGKRRKLSIRTIRGLERKGKSTLILGTSEGRSVRLRLAELDPVERQQVYDEIATRMQRSAM